MALIVTFWLIYLHFFMLLFPLAFASNPSIEICRGQRGGGSHTGLFFSAAKDPLHLFSCVPQLLQFTLWHLNTTLFHR